MKTKLLIIALSFLSLNSYSQIKFEAGYFINNTGERIDCLIRNVDWKNNPTQFIYKLSEDSETVTGTIQKVKEFGVSNYLKYQKYEVDIDRTSEYLKDLTVKRTPEFNQETLFLKVLVEGGANLYYYEQGNVKRFFYKYNDSLVRQLVYMKYMTSMSSKRVGVNSQYKSQLWSELRCGDISSLDIAETDYAESSLIKYFVKFNSCMSVDYREYKKRQDRTVFNLSLRPRINFSSYEHEYSNNANSIYYANRDVDFGSKITYGIGLEGEFILPFNINKWALFFEMSFNQFKSEVLNEPYTGLLPGNYTVQIDYKAIEIPVGVRYYMFISDKFSIYLNGGVAFGEEFKSSTTFDHEDNERFDVLEIDGTQEHWFFGGGFNYGKKMQIEFRYKSNRNLLSRYHNWDSEYKTFSIIIGYNML